MQFSFLAENPVFKVPVLLGTLNLNLKRGVPQHYYHLENMVVCIRLNDRLNNSFLLYRGSSQVISVYRNKSGPLEFVAGGGMYSQMQILQENVKQKLLFL